MTPSFSPRYRASNCADSSTGGGGVAGVGSLLLVPAALGPITEGAGVGGQGDGGKLRSEAQHHRGVHS